MQDLALHLLRPVVANPDAVAVQALEGDDATILEAVVHADDRALLEQDDGRTLRAIRTILSAAAGRRKATLELVDDFSDLDEEE